MTSRAAFVIALICCAAVLVLPCFAHAETGIASWYGPGFHGRTTANGERFNQDALTCAHRTAKFGTIFRVTDTRTGRSITCRVNDRGPWSGGRVIDLSKAAASKLGILSRGTARVTITRTK